MKFKLGVRPKTRHADCVTAIGWSAGDNLYSIGDDAKILRWSVSSNSSNSNNATTTSQEVAALPEGVYATDMQWFPGIGSGRKHGSAALDTFAMASSDGRFYFVSASGRIEKVVDAHKGACVCLAWSADGTTLATGGEDGAVKIWSRAGMQRTVLAQKPHAIYGIAWSADSERVVFCSRDTLCIKPLAPGSTPNEWVAHESLILAVDWSAANGCICSGSEDRTYRIWDAFGRLLYTSMPEEQPITALAWSPDGAMLGVGAFNTLRLCDASGVSQHVETLVTGSLYRLAWSSDNTKLAAGSAMGFVIFAQIVLRTISWNAISATLTDVDKILVADVQGELNHHVELPQPVMYFSLGFDHLIAVTSGKLHIFSLQHLTTPTVIELKDATNGILFAVQAQQHFAVVTNTNIYVYGYQGRLVSQPRNQGVRPENLGEKTLALNQTILAFVDKAEPNKISCYDAITGRDACEPIIHREHITRLGIEQASLSVATTAGKADSCCFVSFIDTAMDLYIAPVVRNAATPSGAAASNTQTTSGTTRDTFLQAPRKVGAPVTSAQWHAQHAILTFIEEATLKIISHPIAGFILRGELLQLATFSQTQTDTNNINSTDLGRRPQIESFIGSRIAVRRANGVGVAHISAPAHLIVLHEQFLLVKGEKANWPGALKICRMATNDGERSAASLWAACAAFAVHNRQLDAAEAAFGALRDFPKIEALQNIKRLHSAVVQRAEMSLFAGDVYDAESLLLQNGMIFRAVMMHVSMFSWPRALQVAQRYKKFIDIVVGYRQQYLQTMGGKKEILPQFLALTDTFHNVDWASIQKLVSEQQMQAEAVV